ncbi:hypothetical protein ONZ45_g14652 [Pleurotus djamor]|nr:hypothetical protein ONZ45_g14652 [Pleurotus djamor]
MVAPTITGPLALGYELGFILFGIFVLQLSFYNTRFPKDPIGYKALAWGVCLLEFTATVISSVGAWDLFGTNWGNTDSLQAYHWTWYVIPLIDGLVAPAAQVFFAWRIFRASKRMWVSIPVVIASFLQLFATYYACIGTLANGRTPEQFQSYTSIVDLGIASAFVCNTLIASIIIAMTLLKSTLNTDPVGLLGLVAESNILVAVGSLIQLILWRTMPTNNIHYMFFILLGRLYANTLMVALNARVQYSATYTGHIIASRDGATLWADVSRHNATFDGDAGRRNSFNVNGAKIVSMYAEHDLPRPTPPTYKSDTRALRFDESV